MLLNESLATTSVTEGLFIAKDVVKAMRYLGVRCIFNTHMHDLARSVDEINSDTEGDSRAASLVTGVHDGERSFRVSLLPPQGVSYAKDIAVKYGISFTQIKDSIEQNRAAEKTK
jgi:DNA mismatch repair ATPase MutS